MLAYEMSGGEDLDEIIPFAMSSEFIHTASLVHDDINDESLTRRGQDTIHAKFGQAKAIIAGDWLFSQGFDWWKVRKRGSGCNGSLLFKISKRRVHSNRPYLRFVNISEDC